MNWALIWPDRLLDELARQYVRAKHAGLGTAFTQAVHRLERRLGADPFADTESRGGRVRVIIEAPVTLYYEAEPDLTRVRVLGLLFAVPKSR